MMMRRPVIGGGLALVLASPVVAQRVDHDALQAAVGEPVTTSVTGRPQRASEAPASIVIITRDQIVRSPARDVPGLLKTYAGIDVNRWTAGQSDVAVRGGVQTYNPRLLVLVNGRQVYLDHYGMTDWNLLGIQLEEVQQIELVRGPAGALFGFNAADGVVNIITIDPLDRRQATITAEGGNHGYGRVAATLATPLGHWVGLRLSAGHAREDERSVPNDQYAPLRADPVTRSEVNGALSADLDARTRLTLTGGYARNRQLELLVTQITSEQLYRTQTAGLTLDHDTPWGSLSTGTYSNWLQARYGIGATAPGAQPIAALQTFDLAARTVVANASGLVELGGNNVGRVGVEYRDNAMTSGVTFSRLIGYGVMSGNAMLDLHPTDRLDITLAGRLDHLTLRQGGRITGTPVDSAGDYDRSFTTASFNAGMVWRLNERSALRLNGGRAVQAPSLVVFGMSVPVTFVGLDLPVVVAGDPSIKPVIVWSGEAGYTQSFSSTLRLDLNGFYTRTEHAIGYPGDNPSIDIRLEPSPVAVTRVANVGDFDTYGVEFSASGALSERLAWRANYTFTATREQLPDDDVLIAYSFLPAEATPRHKVNVVFDYAFDRWSASAVGRFTSATRQISTRPDTFLQLFEVNRAIAVDARLTYRLREWASLSITGENLTKAAGATLSAIPADRRVRAGVTFRL